MAVYLVRHAVAIGRSAWNEDDDLRPLTKRGERQAAGFVPLLDGADVRRIMSSPALRCVDTMAPLAFRCRLEVRVAPELAEGTDGRPAYDLATAAAAKKGDTVLCTHGDVVPEVLRRIGRDGVRLPEDMTWPKGSTWILDWDGKRFTAARYLPPPA